MPRPRRAIILARSIEEDRNNRYRNERALAWMLIGVSALLLLVTASGIVGMTMLRVAQRRKQIGVRRALGARRVDIVRYFVTENLLDHDRRDRRGRRARRRAQPAAREPARAAEAAGRLPRRRRAGAAVAARHRRGVRSGVARGRASRRRSPPAAHDLARLP